MLGQDFDVCRFRPAVLDTGALPLHGLDGKIQAWTTAERKRFATQRGKGT